MPSKPLKTLGLWHTPPVRKPAGFLLFVAILVSALVVAAAGLGTWAVQRSLAPGRETRTITAGWPADAAGRITIDLDSLGIPTIHGRTEVAVAFGQGYAHARDRRFQMELFRRTAAGRLAELVGGVALPSDRFFRRLGLAVVADSGIALLGPRRRAIFAAYAAGVNAYDDSHPAPPEFLVLGVAAEPWRPRDTGLVALLMQQDQGWEAADDERKRETMEEALPRGVVDFLLPVTTAWDIPMIDGPMPATAPLPTAEEFDARRDRAHLGDARALDVLRRGVRDAIAEREPAGSNGWVVAGGRTKSGKPLLANDPHLTLRVPTIWHRQSLVLPDVTITGITLPGVPGVVAGTNGAIAWGVTNPSLDAVDLVRCTPVEGDTTRYLGPAGATEPFGERTERIAVKGAPAETLVVRTTRFGPVIGESLAPGGGVLAAQWTALDPRTIDTDLFGLDCATSLDAFLVALDEYRGPQLSFVAADTAGRIGWKVGGMLPRRAAGVPFDRPVDARDPRVAWLGMRDGAESPALVDPPAGFLVTSNQRTGGGATWELMGGRVAAPWRARRIAATLAAADSGSLDVAAMVALQNDLDAAYLEPTARAVEAAIAAAGARASRGAGDDTLARVARLLAGRERRADSTSVAQAWLVQARAALNDLLLEPFVGRCVALDSGYVYDDALVDEVTRRLLEARAAHLLSPRFADYDALVLAAARLASARLGARAPKAGTPFDRVPWGAINRADVVHPLGAASPYLGRVLDMPKVALSGGTNVVRVMRPRHGATMRLVVDLASPEASARFAFAGGQSGHFRSPHYGDQFATWVAGGTTALLPGRAVGRIVLDGPPPPPAMPVGTTKNAGDSSSGAVQSGR